VLRPDADAIEFDVHQGQANEVIEQLREVGLGRRGSIFLEHFSTEISSQVLDAKHRSIETYAPVWEEVDGRIRTQGAFTPSWYALLAIAGIIGAVGLLTNSQILVVAAMVVGPDYAAVASLAFGVTSRDRSRVTSSSIALVVGFSLAVIGAFVLGAMTRAAGLEPKAFALGVRPVSHLVYQPNWFSVIVAVVAGLVGVISLSEDRAGTLIGVFISVTTVPAAADIGVSIAAGSYHEALGSFEQLLLNLALLVVVAIVGMPLQRGIWRHLTAVRRSRSSLDGR
jgi:uncharacterized hydrophobic protein (TIGR00271 family)